MIRTKILGPNQFSQAQPAHLFEPNSDLGHFSIGPGEVETIVIQERPQPPKQLWIRARVHLEPSPDIPVIISNDHHFIWQGNNRLTTIKLEAMQILYAQKTDHQSCWQLCETQEMYTYEFAIAPTIYSIPNDIHLWPCGGSSENILEAEQLFAQVGSDAPEMFTNTYSSWKKYIDSTSPIVFEPPCFKEVSFLDELKTGKFLAQIEQHEQQFCFASCQAEATNTHNFIDILCERTQS